MKLLRAMTLALVAAPWFGGKMIASSWRGLADTHWKIRIVGAWVALWTSLGPLALWLVTAISIRRGVMAGEQHLPLVLLGALAGWVGLAFAPWPGRMIGEATGVLLANALRAPPPRSPD